MLYRNVHETTLFYTISKIICIFYKSYGDNSLICESYGEKNEMINIKQSIKS